MDDIYKFQTHKNEKENKILWSKRVDFKVKV